MVEVNEFLYAFLLFAVLFETMLLIGIFMPGKQRKKGTGHWYSQLEGDFRILVFPALILILIGFWMILKNQMNDSLFSVGIALIALGVVILIFDIQEKSNKKLMERIDKSEINLKSEKKV